MLIRNSIISAVLLTSVMAHADDRCQQGYVWREAVPDDHVCVTPDTREATRQDNRLGPSRRNPSGGPFGPDTCLEGFVWREAAPGDHVCVIPATRDQAHADNGAAAGRRLAENHIREILQSPGSSGIAPGEPRITIEWRPGRSGSVPGRAVLGGWEKWEAQAGSTEVRTEGPLYICRAPFGGAVYIGKIVKNNCNFGAEGKEHLARDYEVLTWKSPGDSLGWRRSATTPPQGALTGGRSPAGRDLYICRIPYNGGIHPGWQVPGRNVCSIGFGGAEIQRPGMSYLVPQKGVPFDDQ